MKVSKEIVKYKIWRLEWLLNGFKNLSGADIKVTNIRLMENKVLADLRIIPDIEGKIVFREKDNEYNYRSLGLKE